MALIVSRRILHLRDEMPADNHICANTAYLFQSRRLIASLRLFGAVHDPKRATTTPSRETRNLVKFHFMDLVPSTPALAPCRYRNRGCAFSPLTSTFANIGKLMP